MIPTTLFDKIWNQHVVRDLGNDWALLHIDRHVLHDLSGPPALAELKDRNLSIRNPELTFATPDHLVSSGPTRVLERDDEPSKWVDMRITTRRAGIPVFDVDSAFQGIVHVMGPELGLFFRGRHSCAAIHTRARTEHSDPLPSGSARRRAVRFWPRRSCDSSDRRPCVYRSTANLHPG